MVCIVVVVCFTDCLAGVVDYVVLRCIAVVACDVSAWFLREKPELLAHFSKTSNFYAKFWTCLKV